jgi:two-component sensor histidine kinase
LEGTVSVDQRLPFLQGDGRSAALVSQFDWSTTPLGPIDTWPISLKTSVGTILNSSFPAAVTWGPDLTLIYNDPFHAILGNKPEAMGKPFSVVWAEAWDTIGPIAEKARAGEATFIEDFPLTVERNGYPEQAFFTFCYSPLRDDDGQIAGMLDTVIETTRRVETERRMQLMNAELQHRMKNIFATVTSIVSQTLRGERPVAETRPLLLQRLAAIAGAHTMMTDTPKGDVPVRQVLDTVLSVHRAGDERIEMDGPTIAVDEKQALSLALAINELATNAFKYGALSADAGRVRITWQKAGEQGFDLSWVETGGPMVRPPERRGFGTTLMERVAPHDFGGTGTLTYAPDGLRYALSTPRLNIRDRA